MSQIKNPSQITELIRQSGGYLPVQHVQSCLAENDLTIDQFMLALLPIAATFSVAPISHFKASAVALGESGNLYVGANQEFYSLPLNQATHAEQSAVVMAHLHGETSIAKMSVSAMPCGHCRQFLYEMADAGAVEILLPDRKVLSLSHLLPHAFGPKDLGVEGGMLNMSHQSFTLSVGTQDELMIAALRAANKSYSPYAKAYSGVALRTQDGEILTGSYLENAAFNPGLSALQAAFVPLILNGFAFKHVKEAALVQAKKGAVQHQAISAMVLKTVCPAAVLNVGECE
jgi:cytidine deaminase